MNQKHSMLNNSCLKLKEHYLRARKDPDPGALHCGCGQSMLVGFAQRTDSVHVGFGGVAVAVMYRS